MDQTHVPAPSRVRRILVCYDGTGESRHALARTAELARPLRASVSVISVAEPLYNSPPYTGYADPGEEQAHGRLLEEARETLAAQGLEAATVEPAGKTADEVVEAARALGADLIVVGTRRRGIVERLVRGSVSGELVVEAPCDVLVVR
jgi:nucleotide-binding universal stress UspA family protein